MKKFFITTEILLIRYPFHPFPAAQIPAIPFAGTDSRLPGLLGSKAPDAFSRSVFSFPSNLSYL